MTHPIGIRPDFLIDQGEAKRFQSQGVPLGITIILPSNEECSICLSEINPQDPILGHLVQHANKINTYVFHGIHRDCISRWVSIPEREPSCPICRERFSREAVFKAQGHRYLPFIRRAPDMPLSSFSMVSWPPEDEQTPHT